MRVFLLILIPFALFGQVRPDQAPLEANPNNSNFEAYSQKGGTALKRATLYDLKRYYTPDVITSPVNYTPAASGNLQNRMEFVKDPAGEIWFIDSQGEAFKLSSSGGWIWRTVNLTTGSPNFTLVGSVSSDPNNVEVMRNGLTYRVGSGGLTYNSSTGQFSFTRAIVAGEQIIVKTKS